MVQPTRGPGMAEIQFEGGVNSVRRIEVGCRGFLSSWRRFHIHCASICQTRLSIGRIGTPAITVLLTILISQHGLETATMQVELDHIASGEPEPAPGLENKLIHNSLP